MTFARRTPPRPIEGDPCADPRVDCAAYRAAIAAAHHGEPAPAPVPAAEYPPLRTLARNATAAAGRALQAAVSGRRVLAPAAARDRRLAICGQCPHRDSKAGRCRRCGCVLYAKASFATEGCPDGRW